MVKSQRERILRALADVMAEYGYTATSIAQILKRAGVSRETFYEQFRSKEDCFEAGFGWAVAELSDKVRRAVYEQVWPSGREGVLARVNTLLESYLAGLAEDPGRAKVFLVEVFAAGSRLIALRAARQTLFADMLVDVLGARTKEQIFACQSLVAAISTMVTFQAAQGDFAGVLQLRAPMLDLVERGGALYGTALTASS